jgi:hypothetical protein
MAKSLRNLLQLLLLTAATGSIVYGQVNGKLSGVVTDSSGAPILGARVVLTLLNSSVEEATTMTDPSGVYQFPSLRPTFFDLTVEAPNFKRQSLKSVKIDPLQETSLPPLQLAVGDVKETVVSDAATQTLNTTDAQVATTVNYDQVARLPFFQRDPLNLLDTLAGVGSNGRNNNRTVNGLPASLSNVTYDGINIQTNFIRPGVLNSLTNALRTDQLSEVTIVTVNPASAYSGGATQVAFSTPSGTSSLRGSFYTTFMPSGLGAQAWRDNQSGLPVDAKFAQYGVVLAGPIVKDKLFFYANYENLRDRSTVTRTGFTLAQPIASTDAAVQSILALLPAPNRQFTGRNNFRLNQEAYTDLHIGLARLDYIASPRNQFGLSTSLQNSKIDIPSRSYAGSTQPYVYQDNSSPFLSAFWRFSASANLVNEFRGGFNLPTLDFRNSLRDRIPYTIFGSAAALPFDNPLITLDPQGRTDYVFNLQDNVSFNRGGHSMQFGFAAQQFRLNAYGIDGGDLAVGERYPEYWIAGCSGSGASLAACRAGLVSGAITTVGQRFQLTGPSLAYNTRLSSQQNLRSSLWSAYFQDNWRVRNGLTLNLGIRYDYLAPVRDTNGIAITPNVGGDPYASLYANNFGFAFNDGNSDRRLYRADRNNFSPYLGFAWTPASGRQLVVRGGYSVNYVNDDFLRNMTVFSIQNGFTNLERYTGLPATARLANPPAVNVTADRFPQQLSLNNLATLGDTNGGAPWGVDSQLKMPYVQQWNFGVEADARGWIVGARYVGNHLIKGIRSVDVNQINLPQAFVNDFRSARNRCLGGGANYSVPGIAGGASIPCGLNTGVGLIDTVNSLLITGQPAAFAQFLTDTGDNDRYSFFPNRSFTGRTLLMSNLGRSRYDALQLTATRRTRNGLSANVNYTWSKTLSNLNDYSQGAQDPFLDIRNQNLDKAISPQDLRHALKVSWIYDLPSLASNFGLAAKVVNGWSVSGILITQSGAPFSFLSALQNANLNTGRSTLTGLSTPDAIRSQLRLVKDGQGTSYLQSSRNFLAEPEPGDVGTLPLRGFQGPWQTNFNFGLRKLITFTDRYRFEFRTEALNLFNNVNWVIPDQTLPFADATGGLTFGRDATQSNTPRRVQFTLRLFF